jgi:hypothetical protein
MGIRKCVRKKKTKRKTKKKKKKNVCCEKSQNTTLEEANPLGRIEDSEWSRLAPPQNYLHIQEEIKNKNKI